MGESNLGSVFEKISPTNLVRAVIPPLEKTRLVDEEHSERLCRLVGEEALEKIKGVGDVALCHDRYGHEIYAVPYREWVFAIGTNKKSEKSEKDDQDGVVVDFLLAQDFEKLQKIPRVVNIIKSDNAYLHQRSDQTDVSSPLNFLRTLGDIVVSIGKVREVTLRASDERRGRLYRRFFNRYPEAKVNITEPTR